MHQRHVAVPNVTVTAPGNSLVGVNSNHGDTATISGVTIIGDADRDITVCQRFIGDGDGDGDEPTKDGSGPDGTHCRYSSSDITYRD